MEFSMLMAMDGNESLKRVQRARREKNMASQIINVENIERDDSRVLVSDMYLSEAAVNHFRHEVKCHHQTPMVCQQVNHNIAHVLLQGLEGINLAPKAAGHVFPADAHEGRPVDGIERPNPCIQRWMNLADECTKRRLGIFHETGLFLAVCRHGTVLVMCDMVQSGEL
jgi:Kyakuja-Dileera-Zisupton transposase